MVGGTTGVAAAALVAVTGGGAYSEGLDAESADASSDVADDDDDDDVGAASAGSELVRLAGEEAAKGESAVATTRWAVVGSGAWPVGDGARAVAAEAVAAVVVAVTAAASTVERGLTR